MCYSYYPVGLLHEYGVQGPLLRAYLSLLGSYYTGRQTCFECMLESDKADLCYGSGEKFYAYPWTGGTTEIHVCFLQMISC